MDQDGVIYFYAPSTPLQVGQANTKGNLTALDENGSIIWLYQINSQVSYTPAIMNDSSVLIATYDGHLYCIYPNGTTRWSFKSEQVEDIYNIASPALTPDGNILYGSPGGTLYCLDPNGTILWSKFLGGSYLWGIIVGNDGYSIVTNSSTIWCLNASGDLRWKVEAPKEWDPWIFGMGVGPDGTVYIGSMSGLRAIGEIRFDPLPIIVISLLTIAITISVIWWLRNRRK
jgi:outer membrane protein assembly factor BamB